MVLLTMNVTNQKRDGNEMIEIQNVTKRFQDRKISITALNHVSFTVQAGEIVGLLGKTVQGKRRFSAPSQHCLHQQKDKFL